MLMEQLDILGTREVSASAVQRYLINSRALLFYSYDNKVVSHFWGTLWHFKCKHVCTIEQEVCNFLLPLMIKELRLTEIEN